MVSIKQNSLPKNSIRKQFHKVLIIFYLLSLVASIAFIAVWTRYEVYLSANKELTLLVDMVKAARTYIAEDVRPYMLPRKIFHPPAISSTVATKKIAGHFLKTRPDYYIRVISDNPLNQTNKPTEFEKQLLERFREDRNLERIQEAGLINDKNYLVSSRPSISRASCLVCHGKPEEAPKEITQEYGTESGYGYISDRVVGASVVGVPVANVNQIVLSRSIIALIVISMLFLVIFLMINRLVQQLLLGPIEKISRIAREVSEGSLDYSISSRRRDEIGELANSFELMRRSLLTASKRLKKISQMRKR
ncbi:MAG: DUF3365 domain-containing protein [Prochloraceae cyanobacterium]|nr:DUF3365 domain-containing protein [Prochloraceae cyanobacterium]